MDDHEMIEAAMREFFAPPPDEAREQAIIDAGQEMLAARWDTGLDQGSVRSLVEHDITRPRTPEEQALEAGAIADGQERLRRYDDGDFDGSPER